MLKLYNTLSQHIEEFTPIEKKHVTIYVCGITPYDTTHLGHAFTYLSFDVLIRYLQYCGYKVHYTQNVTDINDRDNDILKRAKEQNVPWQELATHWTTRFLDDMHRLNWRMPDNYLKASEQIDPMVVVIQKILSNGFGYEKDGSVYLDVTTYRKYGQLSRLNKEQMLEKAKEFEEDLENPDKRHPLDITLWKTAKTDDPVHIPSFDSPWGKGRPGWHLECSAMSIGTLGEQIDMHGGGKDLMYPHHESEIAQSESATGKSPFVRYWMHTGIVFKDGQKMSKSLGNLVMASDLLQIYSPDTIRFFLLSHHYRKDWDYHQHELKKAEEVIAVFKKALDKPMKKTFPQQTKYAQEFIKCMNNDLDVRGALSLSIHVAQKILILHTTEAANMQKDLKKFLTVLGFIF